MYRVVKHFHDLLDNKKTKAGIVYHEYNVGDVYPRKGLKPSAERIEELAGKDNKQGMPLIQSVGEETVAAPAEEASK